MKHKLYYLIGLLALTLTACQDEALPVDDPGSQATGEAEEQEISFSLTFNDLTWQDTEYQPMTKTDGEDDDLIFITNTFRYILLEKRPDDSYPFYVVKVCDGLLDPDAGPTDRVEISSKTTLPRFNQTVNLRQGEYLFVVVTGISSVTFNDKIKEGAEVEYGELLIAPKPYTYYSLADPDRVKRQNAFVREEIFYGNTTFNVERSDHLDSKEKKQELSVSLTRRTTKVNTAIRDNKEGNLLTPPLKDWKDENLTGIQVIYEIRTGANCIILGYGSPSRTNASEYSTRFFVSEIDLTTPHRGSDGYDYYLPRFDDKDGFQWPAYFFAYENITGGGGGSTGGYSSPPSSSAFHCFIYKIYFRQQGTFFMEGEEATVYDDELSLPNSCITEGLSVNYEFANTLNGFVFEYKERDPSLTCKHCEIYASFLNCSFWNNGWWGPGEPYHTKDHGQGPSSGYNNPDVEAKDCINPYCCEKEGGLFHPVVDYNQSELHFEYALPEDALGVNYEYRLYKKYLEEKKK